METLVATYALAALVVCSYVGWLGLEALRLAHRRHQMPPDEVDAANSSTTRNVA